MKAIDVLKWMGYDGICGETINVFELDEKTDYMNLLGAEPAVRPETGTYLVVYSDCISEDYLPRVEQTIEGADFRKKAWIRVTPDYTILTDNEVEDAMGQYSLQMIYLWKLEG